MDKKDHRKDCKSTSVKGERLQKTHCRVHILGDIDELTSWIGYCRYHTKEPFLVDVQHALYKIGSSVAGFGESCEDLLSDKVKEMETLIDEINKQGFDKQDRFVLPGGSEGACICHIARTVCRRVERMLGNPECGPHITPGIRSFINRLSDLLYMLALKKNKDEKVDELFV